MEELKLKFRTIEGPGGDCTCLYDVTLNRICTVQELIDLVLKRNEWGYIEVKRGCAGVGRFNCEYRKDKILDSNFSDEVLQRNVIKVSASGGYSRMDYLLELE